MKFSLHRLSSRLAAAACVLSFLSMARAQQPGETPAAPPAQAPAAAPPVAPPAPAPIDAQQLKQFETILTQKFTREPADIFLGVERLGAADPAAMTPAERFRLYFRTGDWGKIREALAQMPPEMARKIFDKILADLTEKAKPNMRLDDVLGLADAAPGEFTGDELRKLGQLLGVAVPLNESYWLSDRLKKGTDKLGGSDPAKRLLAGRILLAAGFKELARAYLPPLEQVEQIADESVRNELTAFLSTQREIEVAQRGQVQKIWEESLKVLKDPNVPEWRKTKPGQALAGVIAQVPQSTLAPVLTELVKNDPPSAVRVVTSLGRKLQADRNADIPTRTDDLKAQAMVANLLADLVDIGKQPWNQLSEMMVEVWIGEAENMFALKASPPPGVAKFVMPEDLLATAPSGKWASALPAGIRDRLDVALSKAILAGANFDQAAERIVEIAKRSPDAGVALAEDFLTVWAKAHNPEIPEALRKKYDLPEDARIPVTPIILEKNIDSLAKMTALFRAAGIVPKDYDKVVNAFDLAYSDAEAYRTSHIEKVFGSLGKMDELLFFNILSRMNASLSDRWRKMEVQKTGLTKRDESQTLEMVRSGYASALQMIEGWLAGHPGGWRALTLAGTLLTDWGDFEYFQELVTTDAPKRMIGYKEKNLQAQEYFNRGAAAYAKEVPKLSPGEYSIEPYRAWFHGLVGIGSGGQLNLSKAMNRAALARIHEHMLALPEKAAKAHLNLFAKFIEARFTDEKEPLHEDLKYKYLASALIITKDNPFTFGAEKKVAYFDELLSEIRLQTRVDGPNTVARDQDFGIIVSVIHTEAMGRLANFGQYLTNTTTATKARPKRNVPPVAKKMREAQGPRDELELGLTEKLSPFFDIKSITFAAADVKPRPTAQAGWDETVLAYVLVRAKDASVDKIPPVELELKFVDLSGPITIPAESAETIIKVAAENAPPRAISNVEITQTLDTRQLMINGALPLEIKATANGLIPELDQLIDLEALKAAAPIKSINPHEGLLVKEINTWGDQVAPVSERLWTIALDGDPIRGAVGKTEFRFPPAKVKDAVVVYQAYNDMDLATLTQPSVQIGPERKPGEAARKPLVPVLMWVAIAAVLVLMAGVAIFAAMKRRTSGQAQPLRARDVFKMPADVDGFAVVALLRRLLTSPLANLRDPQKQELQQDLQRVQEACFGADSGPMSEADLRGVAEKWLRAAC